MTNDDDIWGKPRETRAEAAARIMSGLRLDVDQADPPEVADRKARERRERLEQHDSLFRPGYMEINGRLYSAELAGQLGFEVRYGPAPERDADGFIRWETGDADGRPD